MQKSKKIALSLSKFFSFAIKNKHITSSNIFKKEFNKVKAKSNTKIVLSSNELSELNRYCYDTELPETYILGIMLNTGCSFEETFGLDFDQLNIEFKDFLSLPLEQQLEIIPDI